MAFNGTNHLPGMIVHKFSKDADFQGFVNAISSQSVDLSRMALEQPLDRDCQQYCNDQQSNLRIKSVDIGNTKLLVDMSTGSPRPLVPFSWRQKIFDAIHGLGHPGVERTRQSICTRFLWPNMRHDASKWARECLPCQRSKVTRHVVPSIGEFVVPQKRFEHLNVDLVTLPSSNGFRYLLTIVDRLSRWPQAIPLEDMTAESVLSSDGGTEVVFTCGATRAGRGKADSFQVSHSLPQVVGE